MKSAADSVEPGEERAERPPEVVQSLERGLAVIRAFEGAAGPLTLTEVAQRCGLTRAAARRFLLTLVHVGYVAQEGRAFSLRPRVLELGAAYLSGLDLVDIVRPRLERLASETGESSSVSVLDEDDIVYVARAQTRRIMTIDIAIGTRLPAMTTSMGRVLLAALPADERERAMVAALADASADERRRIARDLERVTADGFALVDQELEEGLRSIAVPIRAGDDRVVAAMNVSTHAARISAERLVSDVLPRLRAAADDVHATLAMTGA
jgi:IclR family pca regulon transcriptional regulator